MIRATPRVRITRMRRILGTITATLAIVAISGVLLSPPKDIPLGDGVDQAYTSEPQEPPTMTLQEAVEVTSAVLQVPEGEVTRDGRSVRGMPVRTAMATSTVLASREAPGILKDPTGDNTDLYAFTTPDAPNSLTGPACVSGQDTTGERKVSGSPSCLGRGCAFYAQESNTGEQSEFFGHRINPPVSIPLGDGVDEATSSAGRGKTVELTDFIVNA